MFWRGERRLHFPIPMLMFCILKGDTFWGRRRSRAWAGRCPSVKELLRMGEGCMGGGTLNPLVMWKEGKPGNLGGDKETGTLRAGRESGLISGLISGSGTGHTCRSMGIGGTCIGAGIGLWGSGWRSYLGGAGLGWGWTFLGAVGGRGGCSIIYFIIFYLYSNFL